MYQYINFCIVPMDEDEPMGEASEDGPMDELSEDETVDEALEDGPIDEISEYGLMDEVPRYDELMNEDIVKQVTVLHNSLMLLQ